MNIGECCYSQLESERRALRRGVHIASICSLACNVHKLMVKGDLMYIVVSVDQ